MEYGTIYFADASALVKLVIDEKGSTELRQFLTKAGLLYTISLCFAEALAVMKRKRFIEKAPSLTQERYISTTAMLRRIVKSNQIKFEGTADLTDVHVFFEAADLSDKYQIDLSDALQIVALKHIAVVGATLINADKELAAAARAENIVVWNCEEQPPPELVIS